MNPGLADCLTLHGTASFNVQIHHQLGRRDGVDFGYPYHLEDTLKHDNHAKLFYLNELAQNRGCKEPFKNLMVLKPSTKEVFLLAYFKEQLNWNTKTGVDKIGRCLCGSACPILPPLPPTNLDKVAFTQIPDASCGPVCTFLPTTAPT
jgi:hypothetical protein